MGSLHGCPNISVDCMANFLLSQPTLRHLGFDKLSQLFKHPTLLQADTAFHLENFEYSFNCIDNEEECLKLIALKFPNVQSMKINILKESENGNVMRHLVTMQNLCQLIIDSVWSLDWPTKQFLSLVGSRLTHLSLSLQLFHAYEMEFIAQECSNLKTLHLFFSNFSNSSTDKAAEEFLPMKYLEGLYLGVGTECDSDQVHLNLTSKILKNCKNLRTVYLTGVSQRFDDNFVENLIGSNCLQSLETFQLKPKAPLTKSSL